MAKSAGLLRMLISHNGARANIWHIDYRGVETMLKRLKARTGLPCIFTPFAEPSPPTYIVLAWTLST